MQAMTVTATAKETDAVHLSTRYMLDVCSIRKKASGFAMYMGYVTGIADTLVWLTREGKLRDRLAVCPTPGVTVQNFIDAVIERGCTLKRDGWKPRHWMTAGHELSKLTDRAMKRIDHKRYIVYKIPHACA